MLRAVVLSVVLLGLATVPVAAQSPAPDATTLAKISSEQRLLVTNLIPVQSLTGDAVGLLEQALGQVQSAVELGNRRASRREVEQWLSTWQPPLLARIAAMRKQADELRPFAAEDYPTLIRLMDAEPDAFLSGPVRGRLFIKTTLDTTQQIAGDLGRAAAGDSPARRRLERSVLAGPIAVLEMGNTTTEAAMLAAPREHPQRAYGASMVSVNSAYIELIRGLQGASADGSGDGKAVAVKMERHIREGRVHTAETVRFSDNALAQVAADPAAKTDYGRKVMGAYESYKTSAAVENQLLDLLASVVARLNGGEDVASAVDLQGQLDALMKRRVQINQDRMAMLGQ
jgi:hypothetical protein